MAWNLRKWVDYKRHSPKGNRPWKEQVDNTRNGKGRYKKGIDPQAIETAALPPTGHLIIQCDNLAVYYYEHAFDIGASAGVETRIVRVEWLADPHGSYHGRPFSEGQLIEELKTVNPTELASYLNRKAQAKLKR